MTLEDINLLRCSPLTDFVEQDEHVTGGGRLGGCFPCRFLVEERGEGQS